MWKGITKHGLAKKYGREKSQKSQSPYINRIFNKKRIIEYTIEVNIYY